METMISICSSNMRLQKKPVETTATNNYAETTSTEVKLRLKPAVFVCYCILLELLLCVFSLCQFIQAWSCCTTVCNKLYLFLVAFNVPVYSLFCCGAALFFLLWAVEPVACRGGAKLCRDLASCVNKIRNSYFFTVY